MKPRKPSGGSQGIITKEFLVGLLAIVWGGYNLLSQFKIIPDYINIANIPSIQMIGNILLALAGFFLWATAYKLWRFRWHSRGLF